MSTPKKGASGRRITRRKFNQLAAATAAAAAAPRILRASDKSGDKPLVFGKGEHTYEVVPNWAKLPDNVKFGNTHGVVEDSQGRMLIHNASPTGDSICIFDADGKFIKSFGNEWERGAHGMTLHKEGKEEFLYLSATSQHRIYKTTLDGEILWSRSAPPVKGVYDNWAKYVPTNIAVAPNGDFYVADGYGQHYIHQYNSKAEYIRSWGGEGKDPGKMLCPHGIWIDTRSGKPLVLVADRANIRLQYFTLDGQHVKFVTDDLRYPCNFRLRGDDLLIPDLHSRVTIFDKNNKLITHIGLGGDDKEWTQPEGYPNVPPPKREVGRFIAPHDACWDHAGNLYVAEWVPDGRVTKLRRVGA